MRAMRAMRTGTRMPSPARVLRLTWAGVRTHVSYMSRSPLEITFAVLVPLVHATLAVHLFRAADDPDRLLTAAVGAGLMGIWSSVLFGSGGAVQNQRRLGTLETLVASPTPLALVLLPITLATAVIGTYAMGATVLWARSSSTYPSTSRTRCCSWSPSPSASCRWG